MKRLLFTIIFILFLCKLYPCMELECTYKDTPVIFDTDLGNDIDDVLALQMLLNYQKQSKINLIGITVSKSNPYSMLYVDGYCRFNGIYDIPLGYIYDGQNKDNGNYLVQTLDTIIEGAKILSPKLSLQDHFSEAYLLQRELLSNQQDHSVVFVVVGPETNLQRLLESKPDKYSNLNGIDLINKKVKFLVLMGGNFDTQGKNFPEWNIVQDIPAAQTVFNKWPTKIVATGFEVGEKLLFPSKIIMDLPDSYKNPLTVSYKLFQKMPYDRQTWDLTAVLYALNQDAGFFDISVSGHIVIDDKGYSLFSSSKNGKHYYLSITDEQKPKTLDALVYCVTNKRK